MSSDEEERSLFKKVYKDPIEIQKARLDRLMNNVEKPVFIPQRRDPRAPRAFQPHEYVRNVMGASAGAGSGEFDIYRGCRRRQMIREAYLTREAREREADEQYKNKVETAKQKSDEQTAKRRQKRLKRKGKAKNKKPKNDSGDSKKTETGSSSSSSEESEEDEADKEEKGEKEQKAEETEETQDS